MKNKAKLGKIKELYYTCKNKIEKVQVFKNFKTLYELDHMNHLLKKLAKYISVKNKKNFKRYQLKWKELYNTRKISIFAKFKDIYKQKEVEKLRQDVQQWDY
jgi:hypothetical protein